MLSMACQFLLVRQAASQILLRKITPSSRVPIQPFTLIILLDRNQILSNRHSMRDDESRQAQSHGRLENDVREPQAAEQKVESVERALSILGSFGDGTPKLSLGDLAERTGFYRSTILRLSASLIRHRYLYRDREGFFSLGPALWRLGGLYNSAFDLAGHVRPVLSELVQETGESAGFFVRQGDHRVCLFRKHSLQPIRHHLEEGAELPLGRGAGSHVVMAFTGSEGKLYEEVRRAGFSFAVGEVDSHTGGVFAPVFDGQRRFLGAIGVSGFKEHFEGDNCTRIIGIVTTKAAKLSETLSAMEPSPASASPTG